MINGMTQGRYLFFTEEENGDLKMNITKEGRKYLREEMKSLTKTPKHWGEGKDREIVWKRKVDDILGDLLEDFMGNGWEWVYPEQIGALTSCNIISSEVEHDEETGEFKGCGTVYAFMRYQLEIEIEELYKEGFCIWDKAE